MVPAQAVEENAVRRWSRAHRTEGNESVENSVLKQREDRCGNTALKTYTCVSLLTRRTELGTSRRHSG